MLPSAWVAVSRTELRGSSINRLSDGIAAMIERSLSILERFTGTPPVGWLGPGLGQRAIDQFDRLYQEGKERAKIMALAVRPYISGQPHRIKYRKLGHG